VRRLRADDVSEVTRIERAVFGAEAWPRGAFAYAAHAFALPGPPRGRLWVAAERAAIVGYAGLELSVLGGEADLVNLAVKPAARRRGVGRRLVETAVDFCRQRGVALLWLRVRASNHAARGFYRRVGFRTVGRFRGYYTAPREDAVLMALTPAKPVSSSRRRSSGRVLAPPPAPRRPERREHADIRPPIRSVPREERPAMVRRSGHRDSGGGARTRPAPDNMLRGHPAPMAERHARPTAKGRRSTPGAGFARASPRGRRGGPTSPDA
jgi:ribosomal-protein-alanine N-acetyltransferase